MVRRIDRRAAARAAGGVGESDSGSPGSTATVVVTGSTRGLGFALAQELLRRGCQVLVSGRSAEAVREALGRLASYRERVHGQTCDVTDPAQVGALWDGAVSRWGRVDIWINNAGVAQEYVRAWELPTEEVIQIVETNILGVMHGSRVAMRGMRAQGGGAIYSVEGWGSDGKRRDGLTVYGTTKRAVRYFARGLADEAANGETPSAASSSEAAGIDEASGGGTPGRRVPGDGASADEAPGQPAEEAAGAPCGRVLVGTLSPGMMVTDFLLGPMERMADAERLRRDAERLRRDAERLRRDAERLRRVVNILGDRPETVAAFLAPRILANRRNHAHIAWLTGARVMGRFLSALLRGRSRRRDLFAAGESLRRGEGAED